MTAEHTICAEMAFMFMERNSGRSTIDYPMGGSGSIIRALVAAIEKRGGRVMLRAHVEQILLEGGRAVGVKLRQQQQQQQPGRSGSGTGGQAAAAAAEVIRAMGGVVSNASVWDTQKLLPQAPGALTGAVAPAASSAVGAWRESSLATPQTESFVHLHLGIDATGLPDDLECHHLFVNDWSDITTPQNVCIASIPTVFDPSLAPPGKAVVHAYTAGNEPYDLWQGLDTRSEEYKELKAARSEVLWAALEKVIPDVRARAEVKMVGSPLTHERFLRRHRGSYGPAISAKTGTWPGPKTPVPGLYACGDSCMPGIGVPAAAASGMIAANTLAPVWSQLKLLDTLGL